MSPLLLALVLSAPPPASKAESLAAAKQWEELYLAFASASPKGYSKADAKKVAKALARGCEALVGEDAVMGYSLGEKSVAFEDSPDGRICAAQGAARSDQRGAAEELLERGAAAFPRDMRLKLELGRFLLEDKDGAGAIAALKAVPKKAKEWADAQSLLARARALEAEKSGARAEAAAQAGPVGKKAQGDDDDGPTPVDEPAPLTGKGPPTTVASRTYESSVDGEGRRIRQNQHFRFRYFNGQRDFGQRAEYEGKVQGALEEARVATQRILGRSRDTAVDVILYSREEFMMHHGPMFAMAVAGFYSESAIRMNDSAEINQRNQTTLVHEYTHALFDEASGFRDERLPTWLNEGLAEYTEWRYEGTEQGPRPVRQALQQAALSDRLPTLASMTRGSIMNQPNVGLAYATGASAVRLMLGRGGTRELFELIAEVGKGADFDKAFENRYGRSVERFQEELVAELKAR